MDIKFYMGEKTVDDHRWPYNLSSNIFAHPIYDNYMKICLNLSTKSRKMVE